MIFKIYLLTVILSFTLTYYSIDYIRIQIQKAFPKFNVLSTGNISYWKCLIPIVNLLDAFDKFKTRKILLDKVMKLINEKLKENNQFNYIDVT